MIRTDASRRFLLSNVLERLFLAGTKAHISI